MKRRTLAVGDVTQVCVAAERPLSRGETFDIDFVTVEALPDAKPHTVTFAVNAGLDEGHHELRWGGGWCAQKLITRLTHPWLERRLVSNRLKDWS